MHMRSVYYSWGCSESIHIIQYPSNGFSFLIPYAVVW
uniref:Uncharacterized protein n=1 Tax=Rhizophora mucronata TaxID=61149 RepID=A0A2P2NUF5_RHIMU